MRVPLTSERAHNNQPATNTCRTARSCKIDQTPSLVIDAALHLRSTTNTHNRTHPPERKHPGQHLSGSHSRTSSRNSTTTEMQKRSGKRIRRHVRHATPRRIHRTCTVHGDAPHAYKRADSKRPTSHQNLPVELHAGATSRIYAKPNKRRSAEPGAHNKPTQPDACTRAQASSTAAEQVAGAH